MSLRVPEWSIHLRRRVSLARSTPIESSPVFMNSLMTKYAHYTVGGVSSHGRASARPNSPLRLRLVQALSDEPVKPRLIYHARALNLHCRHVPFTMDTVGTVAHVGRKIQGSLEDRSGFHHVLLKPRSWTLFRLNWRGCRLRLDHTPLLLDRKPLRQLNA